MAKRGRPKGSKNKIRRNTPLGSKKKKGRGRPKGSKGILTYTTPIIRVSLRCSKCRRRYKGKFGIRIDKSDFHLYTKEVKKNWVCPICKVDELVEIKDINGKTITLKARAYKKEK